MDNLFSNGARCINFVLSLYLHHSLCVRAVNFLKMQRTSADASVHVLIKYSLHITSNDLTHFFTKRPFSYEHLWLFSHNG